MEALLCMCVCTEALAVFTVAALLGKWVAVLLSVRCVRPDQAGG